MKIFITLGDAIVLSVIIITILIGIISMVIEKLKKIGKKNCHKCKYYVLDDVASCGDCCWFKCTKYCRKDSGVSFNEREHYEKCNYYEEAECYEKRNDKNG